MLFTTVHSSTDCKIIGIWLGDMTQILWRGLLSECPWSCLLWRGVGVSKLCRAQAAFDDAFHSGCLDSAPSLIHNSVAEQEETHFSRHKHFFPLNPKIGWKPHRHRKLTSGFVQRWSRLPRRASSSSRQHTLCIVEMIAPGHPHPRDWWWSGRRCLQIKRSQSIFPSMPTVQLLFSGSPRTGFALIIFCPESETIVDFSF